ncbi:hypothetical protein D9M68_695610 [compost metagenome]
MPAAGSGFGIQAVVGRHHAARPGEDTFAFGAEALEALPAVNQFQAQLFLQVAQAHRQGRLGDMATRGGLTEMAGFLQRDEELQLLDVHCRLQMVGSILGAVDLG